MTAKKKGAAFKKTARKKVVRKNIVQKNIGRKKSAPKKAAVQRLAGGNPRIKKGDGAAPVRAYLAAMPGWKQGIGKRLDDVITRTVPGVRKAVKWNCPFYGVAGQGWFLSFHVFTRYIKVAFFRGAALKPLPHGLSKSKDVRYLDIYEVDGLDEALLARWVKQAAALPGWLSP